MSAGGTSDQAGLGTPQPWDFAWLQGLVGTDVVWTRDSQRPSLCLADVPQSSPLFQLACEQFALSCRGGPTQLPVVDVVFVRAVHNTDLSSAFSVGLRTMEIRRGTGVAQFNEPIGSDEESRLAIERLKALFLPQQEFRRANVLFAFHGCKPEVAMAIARTGAANLRGTDGGYFGAGIYTTLQAQYAAGYATGLVPGQFVESTPEGCYAVVLCLVAVGNVYPITRHNDYPPDSDVSVFHCNFPDGRRKDKALKQGRDAHVVTISESSGYQVARTGDHGVWDELVLDQECKLLPLAIVYFQIRPDS